jgi:hypothetical protein
MWQKFLSLFARLTFVAPRGQPVERPPRGKPAYPELEADGIGLATAIGVVSMRSVWLEAGLVDLMGAVGKLSYARARALFYSTVAAKARLDMIRSLIALSGIPPGVALATTKALDKAARLFDRRNEFMHGGIRKVRGRRHLVTYKTATERPYRSRPVNEAEIWLLADELAALTLSLDELAQDIRFPVARGSWSGKYPASAMPIRPPKKYDNST